jgi:hypothetical protein
MNDQFESRIINRRVGKLPNSPAVAWVSRLDLDHFEPKLDSPVFSLRASGKMNIKGQGMQSVISIIFNFQIQLTESVYGRS